MDTNNNNHIKDTSPDQAFLQYVSLKKEKLTSALYLVTSFIVDQEPIKWKLRERGLELLSDINSACNSSGLYRVTVLEKVDQAIEQISSLLDIAIVGGFVSDMNAGILKKEYRAFSQAIHDRLGVLPLETLLAAPVPEIQVPAQEVASTQVESGVISRTVPTADNMITAHNSQPLVARVQDSNRPIINEAKKVELKNNAPKITLRHNGHDDNLPLRQSGSNLVVKDKEIVNPYQLHSSTNQHNQPQSGNSRQESILKFVRGRGWTPISDIAGAVPNVSVKTVQRELAELVASGVLKKMGERRWSRYTLARA